MARLSIPQHVGPAPREACCDRDGGGGVQRAVRRRRWNRDRAAPDLLVRVRGTRGDRHVAGRDRGDRTLRRHRPGRVRKCGPREGDAGGRSRRRRRARRNLAPATPHRPDALAALCGTARRGRDRPAPQMSELAAILIGFAAGAVGGLMGVGGGILFVPALTILLNESQLRAESTSLLAIIPVAIVGAWRQYGYGNVRLRDGLVIGALSPVGVLVGAVVSNSVPERALEIGF